MSASPHPTDERCPDENALASFASGALSGPTASSVETHLDGCADCRSLVAAVAAERSSPDAMGLETRLDTGVPTRLDTGLAMRSPVPEAPPLRPGEVLGRYVISGVLGAEGGQVFLAMELVEGPTLAEWLRQRARSWREVLGIFLEAGRGLSAAHRAGLVHRDFKPANVLVGTDGRPRVTDFGLVRLGATWEEIVAEEPAARSEPALTQAGAVPGTPAYMSPEQLAGRPVDARGDQFSFCVALYEALYGLRPFAADAPPEHRWTLRRPERMPRLPRHVKAALARGMALEPEERFASMDALLEVLEKPLALRGRWWALSLAAALALAGVGVGAWRELSELWAVDDRIPVTIVVDESTTVEAPGMARLAVEDPAIVDVVADPAGEQLRLMAMSPGVTTVIVWTKDKTRRAFLVTVKEREMLPDPPVK